MWGWVRFLPLGPLGDLLLSNSSGGGGTALPATPAPAGSFLHPATGHHQTCMSFMCQARLRAATKPRSRGPRPAERLHSACPDLVN